MISGLLPKTKAKPRLRMYMNYTCYIPPSPPPHSASCNITATIMCASRVSALDGHRKRPPVQVAVGPGPHKYTPPHVPGSKCAQWLKKMTTSACKLQTVRTSTTAIGVHAAPFKCKLAQVHAIELRV